MKTGTEIEKQVINGIVEYRRPHPGLPHLIRDLAIDALAYAILDKEFPGWEELSNEELNAITKELKKETE